MSEPKIDGPPIVGLAALLDFESWVDLVFKDTMPAGTIKMTEIEWSRTRQWALIRYAGVPDGPDGGVSHKLIAAMISRMVSVRSRRRDHVTGMLKPVPSNWRPIVKGNFLPLYGRAGSLEIGDGWFDLVLAMSDKLWLRPPDRRPEFDQIKSKYAGLRAYHGSDDPLAEDIVDAFEMISAHVCESCGAPGKVRGRGWLVTACDTHAPPEKTE